MDNQIPYSALVNAIYHSTFDYGIVSLDLTGKILSWNTGAERILGYSSKEVIGQYYGVMFTREDLANNEPQLEIQIASEKGRVEDYRWHVRKDGSRFWADGAMTQIQDENKQPIGYLKLFRDITGQMQAEKEMHRIAYSDMLTGLANRHFLSIQSVEKIAMAMRTGKPMALQLIDLDGFKRVNDTLGHHAGDMLLQQCAARMQRVVRDNDFLARLGGDEFVVLQSNMVSLQSAAELAKKLIRVLSQPFKIDHTEVKISASIGLALCPSDADNLDHLLKRADLALYRAKNEGKGKFHYYTQTLDALAHQKVIEQEDLRYAIKRKEFWLEYQPKISLADSRQIGVEALLRCGHPALRSNPMEYIVELALEIGMMKDLSFWVLEEACRQLKRWKEQGMDNVKVAVNLCSQDLTSRDTLGYIDHVVEKNGISHCDLEIELTERQALEVEKHGLNNLSALRMRGIDVALDDFGVGFSALSYLRNFPVTSVKLDKSFLVDVPGNAQGCAIIKSIVDLSNALGLQVIAEGVETPEQIEFLKHNNCSALQGYLISRPLSAPAMTQWLLREHATLH